MNHSHPREPQYFINSGVQTGQTTYVYPPEGYTMSNLNAFIPSVNTMSIDTEEEKNSTISCTWTKDDSKITVTNNDITENGSVNNNWLAVWRK